LDAEHICDQTERGDFQRISGSSLVHLQLAVEWLQGEQQAGLLLYVGHSAVSCSAWAMRIVFATNGLLMMTLHTWQRVSTLIAALLCFLVSRFSGDRLCSSSGGQLAAAQGSCSHFQPGKGHSLSDLELSCKWLRYAAMPCCPPRNGSCLLLASAVEDATFMSLNVTRPALHSVYACCCCRVSRSLQSSLSTASVPSA
jgi:hypothetical protein